MERKSTDAGLAMTASPTLSAGGEAAAALHERLNQVANRAGVQVAALCELWIQEGLERAESQALAEAAGRCSLRTGTCTLGPVPLPVQQ